MQRFLYSFAYLILLGIPAVILTFFVKEQLDTVALLCVTLIVLVVGGIFDIWAVRQNKKDKFFIWEYNTKSILGFKIYGVPIEDYVFFLILTPFFVITIYEVVKKYLQWPYHSGYIIFFILLMIITYYLTWRYAIKGKKHKK